MTRRKRSTYSPTVQPQTKTIPADLRKCDQWLAAVYAADPERPKQPRRLDGTAAGTNDPRAYAKFTDAAAALKAGKVDALGFAVTAYDPFVLIDLDDCRDPDTGELSEFASKVVDALDTYTEVSLSGRGLHLVCKSSLPRNYKASPELRAAGRASEFFASKGYVLVTGVVHGKRRPVRRIDPTRLEQFADDIGATRVTSTPVGPEPDPVKVTPSLRAAADELAEVNGYVRCALTGDDSLLIAAGDSRADGRPDGSYVVFCAAVAMRAAGMTAGQALSLLRASDYVREDVLQAKGRSEAWLWPYGIGKVFADDAAATPPEEDVTAPADLKAPDMFGTEHDLFLAPIPADEFLVDGFLPLTGVGELYGATGTYKSAVAMDWLYSVAFGVPWMSRAVTRKGPVLLLATEGHAGIPKRARAWAHEHGVQIDPDSLPCIRYTKRGAVQVDPKTFPGLVEAALSGVEGPPALVVVDTLTLSLRDGADENSAGDIGGFLRLLGDVFPRSCVVVVHHTGKDVNKGPRGSSAGLANVDFAYSAAAAGVMQSRLTCTKLKDNHKPAPLGLGFTAVEIAAADGSLVSGLTATSEFSTCTADALIVQLRPLHQECAQDVLPYLPHDGDSVLMSDLITALTEAGVGPEQWADSDARTGKELRRRLVLDMADVGLVNVEGEGRRRRVSLARLEGS